MGESSHLFDFSDALCYSMASPSRRRSPACALAGALVESSNQGEVLILLFCYLGAKHPTC